MQEKQKFHSKSSSTTLETLKTWINGTKMHYLTYLSDGRPESHCLKFIKNVFFDNIASAASYVANIFDENSNETF